MTSAAETADWFERERRKQNAVILALVVAGLLVAFFPRTERRLFAFLPVPGASGSISPPVQTLLRSPIFGGLGGSEPDRKPAQELRQEMVLPVFGPDIGEFLPIDDWRGGLLQDQPLQFDNPSPWPVDLVGPGPTKFPPPRNVPYFGTVIPFFGGAVPEPATWAMMILGIGAIAYRMRAAHARALKRRGRARWRRGLLPKVREARPPTSVAVRDNFAGGFSFRMSARYLPDLSAPAREQ